MKTLITVLYFLLQITWGLPQNLVGFVIFLWHIKDKHYLFHGSVITIWKGPNGGTSMSMGMFVFLDEYYIKEENARENPESQFNQVAVHEFGHSLQSLLLGPLYFFVISIPSGVWCNFKYFQNMRKDKKMSYYIFYPERWANYWGEKITKMKAPK